MPRLKWRWLWIHPTETSLRKLIELLNLRLRQLADFLDDEGGGGAEAGAAEFYFFNDGATLIPGESDWGYIEPACTLTGAQIVADPAGSIAIAVYIADYPTWDAWTLISGANPITLSSVDKAQPALTGWTTAIPAGTYIKVRIIGAVSSIKQATLTLFLEPTT